MKSAKELEDMFGVTAEQIEEWSAACERGEYPGEPVGEIIVGRPLLFGEEMKVVTYKDTASKIAEMDDRAASLDLSRSDYLRGLVRRDLASATA